MPDKEVILTAVTDRSEIELLAKHFGKEGYEVVSAATVTELVEAIQKKGKISLALVDVSSFDHTIWEHLEHLHQARIPFIVMAPPHSPSVLRDSLKHGASSVLTKMPGIKELLEHVHTLLGR